MAETEQKPIPYLDFLERVSSLLVIESDLKEVLRIVFDELKKVLRLSQIAVWEGGEPQGFSITFNQGFPASFVNFTRRRPLKSGVGLVGRAAADKIPIFVKDIWHSDATAEYIEEVRREKIPMTSIYFHPLLYKEKVLGVLALYFPEHQEAFPAQEVQLVAIISNQLAIYIESQRRFMALKDKIAELQRINDLTIGREIRMVELKKENEQLQEEIEKLKTKN